MKLYQAATTKYARHVIDSGFPGREFELVHDDRKPTGEVVEYVRFHDLPLGGLAFSRTTERDYSGGDVGVDAIINARPLPADAPGYFILCIEIPAKEAADYEDAPAGSPFREYWLPPEVANRYRDSLVIFDPDDGEEVQPDEIGE